ncbi:hypothetical protein TNCT_75971 [Trichonephila clavata]|uniref:Uncharacterized protein n=1 Tax=Trichonephila clavata TaxID=2740835 RepID=A0A8X6GI74_TRICU|nr:hypothetical protein TNCT_75971 [Trichonephila clavata]
MGDDVHMMIRPSAVASRRFGGGLDRLASPRLACAKSIASIDGPVMELERESFFLEIPRLSNRENFVWRTVILFCCFFFFNSRYMSPVGEKSVIYLTFVVC